MISERVTSNTNKTKGSNINQYIDHLELIAELKSRPANTLSFSKPQVWPHRELRP